MRQTLLCIAWMSLVLLSACETKSKTDEAVDTYQAIEEAILESYPEWAEMSIMPFDYQNPDGHFGYLEATIPQILEDSLYSLSRSQARFSIEELPFQWTSALTNVLFQEDSLFSNYLSNFAVLSTQEVMVTSTNSNWTEIVTNILETNITEGWTVTITNEETNTVYDLETNGTNYVPVVEYKWAMTTNDWFRFLSNEYPDVLTNLNELDIHVVSEDFATNSNRIEEWYPRFYVAGTYNAIEYVGQPADIQINYQLFLTNQGVGEKVWQKSMTVQERYLADSIDVYQGDIRKHILRQPVGDLRIQSSVQGARVYVDNAYIGETPILYPSVAEGDHEIRLVLDGYEAIVAEVDVQPDIQNTVSFPMERIAQGGELTFTSFPSQASVFLDSEYQGATPVTVSNLEIGRRYRIKLIPLQTNLKPYYDSILVESEDQQIFYDIALHEYEGRPLDERQAMWAGAYTMWMVSAGFLVMEIVTHSKYYDYQNLNTTFGGYESQIDTYEKMYMASVWLLAFSILTASALTALALDYSDVQLGVIPMPNRVEAYAVMQF